MSNQNKDLLAEIKSLKNEIASLRLEIAALRLQQVVVITPVISAPVPVPAPAYPWAPYWNAGVICTSDAAGRLNGILVN